MDWAKILTGLEQGLVAIKTLAPAAAAAGPTGAAIGTAVGAIAGLIDTAIVDAQKASAALHEADFAKLTAMQTEIQGINDQLAASLPGSIQS